MTNKKTALPVCTPRSECNHRIRANCISICLRVENRSKKRFRVCRFFSQTKGEGQRGERKKGKRSFKQRVNYKSRFHGERNNSSLPPNLDCKCRAPRPPSSPPLFPSPIEKRLTNKPLEKRVVPLFAATSFVIIRRGELGGGVCIVARLLVGNVIFPLLFILARRREDPLSLFLRFVRKNERRD